jgi:YVTN family beta-propeller protein
MPLVIDSANLYSETVAGKLDAIVAGHLPRVYVPHVQSNDVYVIDPATFSVVDRFKVGINPQHVVPSWDLRTLWTWKGMPQDIRISPDGRLFYVADMMSDGVFVVDGQTFRQSGFIPTGIGTHGLYPSRDGKKLYVANRGSNRIHGRPKGKGSVSVIDFATGKVETT